MFSGDTYDPQLDRTRLLSQLRKVATLMSDGKWRTLGGIENLLGYPQASISARLRDLRKIRFGEHTVERRRVPEGKGLHEYRVLGR